MIDEIPGVLYEVPTGQPLGVPKRHFAAFGVSRDSGKTTFVESVAAAAKDMKVIVFRTKRGELGFKNARQLPLFFDEKGITHWKALEGLFSANLDEKVQREPGVRSAIMDLCTMPSQAESLREIYNRVETQLANPKVTGFKRDVYTKIKNYLKEILPELEKLRDKFTTHLELPEPGVYVEDLIGAGIKNDDLQNLFVANLIRKVYESFSGVIVVISEIWKFLPQDRGSPVKWIIEKYVREMGAVNCWLGLDAQDLRGVDKKHLRSFDVRLFGRQPDSHEVDEILKELPLEKQEKPTTKQIMTLKLGHFYAKLGDHVKLVYVRPVWLPEEVAVRVAKGALEPASEEVQKYTPEREHREEDELFKEKCDQLEKENEELTRKNRELQRIAEDLASGDEAKKLQEDLKKTQDEVEKLRGVIESERLQAEADRKNREKEEHAERRRLVEEAILKAKRDAGMEAAAGIEAEKKAHEKTKEEWAEDRGKIVEKAQKTISETIAEYSKLAEKNAEKAKKFDAFSEAFSSFMPPTVTATPSQNDVPSEIIVTRKIPDIHVATQRLTVQASEDNWQGRLSVLAKNGFFDKPQKLTPIRQRLQQDYGEEPNAAMISNNLVVLIKLHVLERAQEEGQWAYRLFQESLPGVPDVKDRITVATEAKA